jgi:predicted cupin superfamily sugar epimerase
MTDSLPARAREIIERLGLVPHTLEGGWFAETWRSSESIATSALPSRYGASRTLGTAIYYLLARSQCSAMHRLRSDEVFHFYLGDPVEMLHLADGAPARVVVLGADLAAGQRPQVVVPRDVWQGARLVPGGEFALLGTTVAPGFDAVDFERGDRAALIARWPEAAALISALTP